MPRVFSYVYGRPLLSCSNWRQFFFFPSITRKSRTDFALLASNEPNACELYSCLRCYYIANKEQWKYKKLR